MKLLFFKRNALLCVLISPFLYSAQPAFLTVQSGWAEQTLSSLSRREKIGQLFIIAAVSNYMQSTEAFARSLRVFPYTMHREHVQEMIEKYYVGGVVFLYKSTPRKQREYTQDFQSRSKIPLLIAQDYEWGLSMRLEADPTKVVRYPRNMTLGALQNEQLVYDMAYEIGMQCHVMGVHMNFAPVIDVNNNPENPVIHDRAFSDDREKVARLGQLYTCGLQDAGILSCCKHFPGHGDTNVDSHVDLPFINHLKERLQELEMYPFRHLIKDGVSAVMVGHLAVPALDQATPSSLSYAVVTETLKKKLGFEGLVITDALGMEALTKNYSPGELELQAFLAGNDILLCPLDVPHAIDVIEQAIIDGRVTEQELDRRVLKILQAKEWVFQQALSRQRDISFDEYLVRPETYALQKKLCQNAITVAEHEKITFDENLLQNSLIIQIGTTVDNAFLNACKHYTQNVLQYKVSLHADDVGRCLCAAKKVNTVIIAVGGMNKNIHKKFGIADTTLYLIDRCKALGKRVIMVVFGTPYSVPYLKKSDVVVMAYEDIVAMQEAAVDVLRGALQPVGKFPLSNL